MRLQKSIATATLAFLIWGTLASTRASAQVCECKFPDSNENGHVAGAFGGGLFAGLVAAVLHIKHTREASLQPHVDPFTTAATPFDPIVEASTGSLANEPAAANGDTAPLANGLHRGAAPGATRRPGANRDVGRGPRLSANEAKQEGLIPPKTATMMPAYAMIGLGSLLLGLFLLRERGRRKRRY